MILTMNKYYLHKPKEQRMDRKSERKLKIRYRKLENSMNFKEEKMR